MFEFIYWSGYSVCVALLMITVYRGNQICRGVREPEGKWEIERLKAWKELMKTSPDMSENAVKAFWMFAFAMTFVMSLAWPIVAIAKLWKRL